MLYPSLYRARAVSIRGRSIQAFVPQVFGDTPITITAFMNTLPTEPEMGWVFFQAGNAEFPVWAGVGGEALSEGGGDGGGGNGGGGGGEDEVWIGPDPPPGVQELWYDTDETPPPSSAVPGIAYTYVQSTPSATWTITHPLPFYPNVAVVDSAGDQVEGDVRYTSPTVVTLTFRGAFSGVAYLS